MFRVSQHPSSGVLKTVSATSGIGHDTGTAISFQRGLVSDCAVNKCLHTVASSWTFLLTLNYDAWNHEFKIHLQTLPFLFIYFVLLFYTICL